MVKIAGDLVLVSNLGCVNCVIGLRAGRVGVSSGHQVAPRPSAIARAILFLAACTTGLVVTTAKKY